MGDKASILDRHTLKQYRNTKIHRYLSKLDLKDIPVAIRAINFIKYEFPEVLEVLRGQVIKEETWESPQPD